MPRLLEITYTRSVIGGSQRQRRTLAALGLRKLHHSVRHADTPTIRGMINTIPHLLAWREVEESDTP